MPLGGRTEGIFPCRARWGSPVRRAVPAGGESCPARHTFRFDPRRTAQGQNPFQLDSKAPTADYRSFIENEVRYSSLERSFPDRAQALFQEATQTAADKYNYLLRLSKLYGPEQ